MNRRQKLVQAQFLNDEEKVIKRLKAVYDQSMKDINKKVAVLDLSIADLQKAYNSIKDDDIGDLAAAFLGSKANFTPEEARSTLQSMIQSKVYQKKYQQGLQKQVGDVLDKMQTQQFKTVSDYLEQCYEDGFVGTIFDLQGQGIPMCFPLDQEQMVRAVQLDSKISHGLYTRLGEDVAKLKKRITDEVSRGIATAMSYQQVAQQLAGKTTIGYTNAIRIARTEGHRIQVQAGMDACYKAKDIGADVVKQWDSTLDARTRDSHVKLDGEVRELDEPFSNGLMFPGDPHGAAAEVINCRCALLQRARWALGAGFTKMNNFTKQLETFDSPESYADFKKGFFSDENKRYMKHVEEMSEKYGTKDFAKVLDQMTDQEYKQHYELLKNNPIFNVDKLPGSAILSSGSGVKLQNVSNAVSEDHAKAIKNQIERAHESVRKAWNDCADELHLVDANYTQGKAHYDKAKGGVLLDIESASKGNPYSEPYQDLFHEFGHNIDYILNKKYGTGEIGITLSTTYKNGIFGKTLKREANKAIEDYAIAHKIYKAKAIDFGAIQAEADRLVQIGKIKPHEVKGWISKAVNEAAKAKTIDIEKAETAFCDYIRRELSTRQRGNISDMFEPVMHAQNEYPFDTGHGVAYWWHRDNGKEGFAHMFSAMTSNEQSLEQIKRFFPESYKIFIEMLGVVK